MSNLGYAGVDLGTMQAAGAVPTVVRKTVTFVAGTTGAVGAHALFTVSGLVKMQITGYCTTSLTVGGSTTLDVGTATVANQFFDGQDGPVDLTAVDAGMYIHSSSGGVVGATVDASLTLCTEDVTYTIATSTITGGVMVFIATYIPLSAGASVIAA